MQTIPTTATGAATPVTKKASELGCALNVNLDTGAALAGAGAPTDDTALLNAFLATASATHPVILMIDGAALITGLRLSAAGYTTIQGTGDTTGFFLAHGSNNDGIHNRPPGYVNDPGPPAPPRIAQQVTLQNFRLNGNRGDGHSGNSTNGDTHGSPWLFGINLMDMEQVTLDQVNVVHASTYGIRLSNVGHAVLTRCRVSAFLPTETVGPNNTDGIHINGPSNDIAISGCYFRTGDDAIALNAPEGHGGNIERVTATDCVFDQCQLVMRIYSGSRGGILVTDVAASGFTGTSNVATFFFGAAEGGELTTPDALQNILFHNCQVSSPLLAFVQDNARDITFRDVTWTGSTLQVPIGLMITAGHALTLGTLTLNQCTIRQPARGGISNCVFDLRQQYTGNYATRIDRLVIDGLTCINEPGSSAPSLQALLLMNATSTVGTVEVDVVDARKIAALVPDDEWPRITHVTGSGVLESGWRIPDAKIAANTPYLSDETLLASEVKHGVAHTLVRRSERFDS